MMLCGAGSRSALDSYEPEEFTSRLYDTITSVECDSLSIMSGMAPGFDHALAQVAYDHNIELHLAIPNRGFIKYYWNNSNPVGMASAEELIDYATNVVYVMEDIYGTNSLYHKGKHANLWRNDYMISNSDIFLIYNPDRTPGTSYTQSMVTTAKKHYINISRMMD